ncbi:response regulator transcription factor [Sulfurospirillum arcachonense]|uniref:response regulator transcription factor n=1 Tax=Sulfurospirillum arcachonense TaxID=57666 RepID=UPI000469F60E|nr:response regulator transcription factor [Sulfurospirillum arcachonense]
MKILLLEDNKRLNETIVKRLEIKGFEVHSFVDGEEAYNAIDNGYICFILDINVPSLDGTELLKRIREYNMDTPVIIISSTVELDVIKNSYSYGCNDYLKKPFFIDELEIKIEKLCHFDKDIIEITKNYKFNFKDSLLEIDGKSEHLSRKERLLLNLLLAQRGKVVSFDTIQAIVWEGNYASIDSIRSLVRRVRKKIPIDCIETAVDVGYFLKKEEYCQA